MKEEKYKILDIAEFLVEGLQNEQPHEKRQMELHNIMQIIKGYRQMIEFFTQQRADIIMTRIYDLISNPDSAGNHNSVA